MVPTQIERFFRTLAQECDEPATVILTGAAAGSLWGHIRPSVDIDFAIRPSRRSRRRWAAIEEAIERTVRRTGISANYAEDIDRWSSVSLLDYQRHARPYRRFGTLRVRVLDPAYWSIGKMSRYLDPDVRDVVAVFRRHPVALPRLLRLWARAARASPRSLAVTQFCRQAEHFLRTDGRAIWGRAFDAERAIARFRIHLAARNV
ncbi:MAG: hypothetical protein HYY90_03295 [Candidatus Omnitrophica bacterium]|nr:hypothetical protein [Candidatus Omnitrophota bacterium]MBI3021647.1 hypothetical protein [Candidatus Omnitrophota bacterium]MBI3083369.1 hypothetical protein [Candidatus Omnitrophota bacterium]